MKRLLMRLVTFGLLTYSSFAAEVLTLNRIEAYFNSEAPEEKETLRENFSRFVVQQKEGDPNQIAEMILWKDGGKLGEKIREDLPYVDLSHIWLLRSNDMPPGQLVFICKYHNSLWGSEFPPSNIRLETNFTWVEKMLGVSSQASVSTLAIENSSAALIWLFVNGYSLGQVKGGVTSQVLREGFKTPGGQVGGWGEADKGLKVLIIQNADEGTVPTDHVYYAYFGEALQPETRMVGLHFGSLANINEVAIERAGQIDWQNPLPKQFWFLDDWTSNVIKEQHSVLTEYDKDRRVLKRWGLRLVEAVKVKAAEDKPTK